MENTNIWNESCRKWRFCHQKATWLRLCRLWFYISTHLRLSCSVLSLCWRSPPQRVTVTVITGCDFTVFHEMSLLMISNKSKLGGKEKVCCLQKSRDNAKVIKGHSAVYWFKYLRIKCVWFSLRCIFVHSFRCCTFLFLCSGWTYISLPNQFSVFLLTVKL